MIDLDPLPTNRGTPSLHAEDARVHSESVKALPKSGSVCRQFVEANGKRYGPYWYLFFREKGRLHKRYVRPEDLDTVRSHCEKAREEREAALRERQRTRELIAGFGALFRAVVAFDRDEEADLEQTLSRRDQTHLRRLGVLP